MNTPDFLFHYTNTDSLEFILRDRTFQFSSLELVNDTREGFAKDFGDLRKYVFVNCWTDYIDEKVSLWNLYNKDMKGVRLKFKTPILEVISPDNPKDFLFSDHMIFSQKDQLYKVHYTNKRIELIPEINYAQHLLDFNKIGKYKKTAWDSESEWRHILIIVPLEPETPENKNDFIGRSSPLIKQRKDLPFKKTYRPIAIDSFNTMEITLGPKTDDNDRSEIEKMVEKYNPGIRIIDSSLKGDIR